MKALLTLVSVILAGLLAILAHGVVSGPYQWRVAFQECAVTTGDAHEIYGAYDAN